MIPDKRLYQLSFLNRLKLFNFKFITHSFFVRNWLKKWDLTAEVIYPYLNDDLININFVKLKKEKIVLSVGRFFEHLHAKRQDIIIKSFKKLQQKYHLFNDFKLCLIGGLKEEDKNYFKELRLITGGNKNIIFLPNASYKTLIEHYKKSMFYWHAAGYGIDEKKNPEAVEHMGITPLEAMTAGCVTFCHNSGGPKEIIKNRVNGFLYESLDELINKTAIVYRDENQRRKLAENAKKYITENFSYEVFRKKIKQAIIKT
jgi:glycosyltransferase involved in cell wall biosynthesis